MEHLPRTPNLPDTARLPAIRMEGVHLWLGRVHALRGIDLEVEQGERVVLCGPSGAGKSTLLRCACGLERHAFGRVTVNGEMLTGKARAFAAVRRHAGIVLQEGNLFPHLTVLENCALAPRRVRGFPEGMASDMALRQLDRVGLIDSASTYPGALSAGQRHRVAIARALAMEPRIMLIDEPGRALDPEAAREVLDVIDGLAHDGMTMVVVTHDMGVAARLADRVVFMDEGQIVEIAAPEDFFEAPRHERTRAFLGEAPG